MKVGHRSGGEGHPLASDDPRQGNAMNPSRHRDALSSFANFMFDEESLLNGGGLPGRDAEKEKNAAADDESRKKSSDPGAADPVVLASAIGMNVVQAVQAQTVSAPIQIRTSVGADHANEIVSRIEQALRASLQVDAEAPVAFQIRLDDLGVPGLNSVKIDMAPQVLDVTFSREAGDIGPEALATAQSLARQLAIRFPTRTIRVLDAGAAESLSGAGDRLSGGLRGISELLARRSDSA